MDDADNGAVSIVRVRQTALSANNSSSSLAKDRMGLAARGIADIEKTAWEKAREYFGQGKWAEALPLLHIAATRGGAEAQYNLGMMYADGHGVPHDLKQAADWYLKAAEHGHAGAQFNLGVMYSDGEGVPQDYMQAADWFRKAAEQGDAYAQVNLGAMYHKGEGMPQNYEQAIYWFRKAAEQGDADAQNNLGVMYDNGQGVPQYYMGAVDWYLKAAEQGHADAQFNLSQVIHSNKKAAEKGNDKAAVFLGDFYSNRYGFDKGESQGWQEINRWYRMAAEQGNAGAQYRLGAMYLKKGAHCDPVLAYFFFSLAANAGHSFAISICKSMKNKTLSSEQLEEALMLSSLWKAGVPLTSVGAIGQESQ